MDFDIDALAAEAAGDTHTLTIAGQQITVPAMKDWPISAIVLVHEGRHGGALAMLVGEEEWSRLAGLPELTPRKITLAIDKLSEASGFGSVGESKASGRSSRGTTQRSKRTSKTSTASTSSTSSGAT